MDLARERDGVGFAYEPVRARRSIMDMRISRRRTTPDPLAPAPRYRPGHPFYKFATIGGNPCGNRHLSDLDGEFDLRFRPPADSRLLAHYMTPPPEPASVKLRRKANNDAGGAFRRWARRRRERALSPGLRGDVLRAASGLYMPRPRQREAVSPGRARASKLYS